MPSEMISGFQPKSPQASWIAAQKCPETGWRSTNLGQNELNFVKAYEDMGQRAGLAKLHGLAAKETKPQLRSPWSR